MEKVGSKEEVEAEAYAIERKKNKIQALDTM